MWITSTPRPAPKPKRGCVALYAEFGAKSFDAATRIASGRPARRADLNRSHTATSRSFRPLPQRRGNEACNYSLFLSQQRPNLAGDLTMRLSDAGLRRRQTKALYLDHRPPPWLTEDATRDRSNRLLDHIRHRSSDEGTSEPSPSATHPFRTDPATPRHLQCSEAPCQREHPI